VRAGRRLLLRAGEEPRPSMLRESHRRTRRASSVRTPVLLLTLVLAATPTCATAQNAGSSIENRTASIAGEVSESMSPSIAAGYLPIGISLVPEDMRDTLPLPIGISANFFHLSEDLDVKKLALTLNGMPVPPGAVSFDRLTHSTYVYLLRADVWVLPFLNVYGFGGYLTGNAEHITVSFGGSALPEFDVAYSGRTLGTGFTLAGGYGPLFATFDLNYSATDVDVLDSTVSTLTIDPRVGWRFEQLPVPVSLYAGAMYEGIQGTQRGTFEEQNLDIGFALAVRAQEPWNALLGAQIELGRHWALIAEGGLGNRNQSLVSLRYGF